MPSTYTPAAGSVTIRIGAGEGAGTVVVEVADTGPGMPPEELARAFEFGFRGELAARLRVPGLGAGLWICRELAARNGGSVTLASEPGAGVRATLTLPAAGSAPATAQPRPDAAGPGRSPARPRRRRGAGPAGDGRLTGRQTRSW